MESRIKERLTGALILVAALVILVPEIFSGRRAAERAQQAPAAAPATDGPPLRSYTAELGAAAPPPLSSPEPIEAASEPETASTQDAESQTPAPPAVAPAVQAPPPAASKSVPVPPPAAGNWFVQVGSFSQAPNAERYAQQLRNQGYAAFVLPPAGTKSLSRVRVGPARTREAAGQLLERLAASGHKGAVVGP